MTMYSYTVEQVTKAGQRHVTTRIKSKLPLTQAEAADCGERYVLPEVAVIVSDDQVHQGWGPPTNGRVRGVALYQTEDRELFQWLDDGGGPVTR